MRWATLTFLAASTALGLEAAGDDVTPKGSLSVSLSGSAESEPALPDWYRQFTLAQPDKGEIETNPAIQSAPDDDLRLEWLSSGRWEFSIDLRSRPEDSPLPREEMSAGATFQITPRLSIGGDLSLGAEELNDTSQWREQALETGIRLRSAFKF
jgi:hypothetical protein